MQNSSKTYIIWGAFILGLVALIWGLAKMGTTGTVSEGAGQPTGSKLADAITDTDHSKGGGNDAKVTVVEYSDFQCPTCATFAPILKQIEQDFGTDVRFVYRHYPIRTIHLNAQLAAQASEAASKQNKFWEMHDKLFDTQRNWQGQKDPTDFFVSIAEDLKLNVEQFKKDLTSGEVVSRVNRDYASGDRSNVDGTPTFFINGEQISFPGNYATLKSAIQAKLGGEGATTSSTDSGSTAPTTTAPKVKSAR